MAQDEARSTRLTPKDVDRLLRRLGEAEREYLKEHVREGTPREAVLLAELFHHFPQATLEDE